MDCPTESAGMNKAEPLIAALAMYKEEKGSYPRKLKDLVPIYSRRIPIQFQNHCAYYGSDGKSFHLEFVMNGTSGNTNCYYEEDNEWRKFDSGGCIPYEYLFEDSP